MKKGVKIGLIGCGSIAVLAIVAIVIFVMYAIGGDAQGTPNSVKYHTASDLQKITKIPFPAVELVDSTFFPMTVLKNQKNSLGVKRKMGKKIGTAILLRYWYRPQTIPL